MIDGRRNRRLIAFLIVALAAVFGPDASAQIVHGERPRVTQSLTYLSWDLKSGDETQTIDQWFAPIALFAPLRENIELTVSTAGLRSGLDDEGGKTSLSGVTDSKVQISGSFLEDQLLVSAGVSLPTGRRGLNQEEQGILLALTSDVLNFPLKNPGEGTMFFGQVGVATPAGNWVVGASGAAYVSGTYTPYESGGDYRPGTRVALDFGADRRWQKGHRFAADLVVVYSTDDRMNDQPAYRKGIQFDLRAGGRYALGRGGVDASARYIVRGKDKDRQSSPSRDELASEVRNRNGNNLRLHAGVAIPAGPAVTARLTSDAKILAANDYPAVADNPLYQGAAHLFGYGGGLDIKLSRRVTLVGGGRVWSGTSDGALGLGEFDLSGFELTETLTVIF